jgi:ectoine hydroxylase-related dioxygenase (phytanoyl-CoA dioxygenase family)
MPVLTPQDRDFFDRNGYVVVPDVVPRENLEATVALIWEFLGMDPGDPTDWYRAPLTPGGMLEVYQHPALWNNRQHPRVHQAFADLFGTEKLWTTIDRVNMKPPQHPDHPEYDHKGFMHWDIETKTLPRPFGVQGVLYLADTDETMGGFQCVPGHHKVLEEWAKQEPATRGEAPRPDPSETVPIPGKAGDLLIWDSRLFHGNGHNRSSRPRLAQYISMFPAERGGEEARRDRIYRWENRLAPEARWVIGDPRNWEQEHGRTAELTPLGRKLLGLDLW